MKHAKGKCPGFPSCVYRSWNLNPQPATHSQGFIMVDMEREHLSHNSMPHDWLPEPDLGNSLGIDTICHSLPVIRNPPTSFQSEASVGQDKLAVCS